MVWHFVRRPDYLTLPPRSTGLRGEKTSIRQQEFDNYLESRKEAPLQVLVSGGAIARVG